ncbi:hypothetical protein [Pseudomonas sp. S32]|uniref:hypothetical protein n=1 Tax=Pseudomonas sp. S32 TaxID=2767448 RepID=UPI001911B88E|nr:hypothetical protein [Pseudomonas sp. S32]
MKLFEPVLISDNWYWQKAFTRLTICHRIDAKETAVLRQYVRPFSLPVEHFVVATVLFPPRAANLRTASPEPKSGQLICAQ